MKKSAHVLMITHPIAPPWNESMKNLSYSLALHSRRYQTHLMTVQNQKSLNSKYIVEEAIYKGNSRMMGLLSVSEKLRVLARLVKADPHIDIYHFLMAPKYYQSRVFKLITTLKGKRTVQSIICMITGGENNEKLFFGDEIVVFSDYTKRKIERLTRKNITKIDLGIDVEKFRNYKNVREIRNSVAIKNEKVVLYCGDYTADQGLWSVLRAVPRLSKSVPNILVIFASRDKNREHVREKELLKDEIFNLGINNHVRVFKNDFPIHSLIAACDIGILPADNILSKLDIPLILLECLAAGKPIVITDISPLNEIMRDEVGILLKNNSDDEIVGTVSELLHNKERYSRLSSTARALVERDFTIEKMARAYGKIYDRVIQND